MVGEQQEKTTKFMNAVDKDMHDSILRLDQKLKGLQVEIHERLKSAAEETDEYAAMRQKLLANLGEEIAMAISSIKVLVDMVISDEYTSSKFIEMHHDGLETLREVFKENLDKITEIRDAL